tara:strand:+ start:89 stop:478 length:390 start_codon:yes stop_codon:yes gene_type:complete
MEILYIIIILVIAFVIWSNISTKKLDKIGEIALKQYFDTQNEKYKVMLCVLAATYQNANQNRFWNHFYLFPDNKLRKDLEISMKNAGNGIKDSIAQKKILRQVDLELLEIINKSNLKKFEQYIENSNDQ